MKAILYISTFLLTVGCSFSERIEITSEYVINENWSKRGEETGGNSIEVRKMNLKKDSTINPFSDLNQAELMNKLVPDSSFMYTANVKIKQGESYKNKKIYFNQDNGFDWWTDQGKKSTRVIGKLQPDTWYEISRLSYYHHIVYVDSTDKVHAFVIDPSNW